MLKWVKSNLETKNASSKKSGVVMKGKSRKKSPNPENGTPRNTSKTSSASVAGLPSQSTGATKKGPPPPPPPLPSSLSKSSKHSNSGGQPPPPIDKKSKSPTSSTAQVNIPSVDEKSNFSKSGEAVFTSSSSNSRAAPSSTIPIHKDSTSQDYNEHRDYSSDQNSHYINDQQCYLPNYDTEGIDIPPDRNSQDSPQTYRQNFSNNDTYDQNNYSSKNSDSVNQLAYEYDPYTSRDYASSHSSTHGNHQSSTYVDSSFAQDSGSSCERGSISSHGPSSPQGHSGPSSSHSGPSSPYDHSNQSSPHGHVQTDLPSSQNQRGPSSPHGHTAQQLPQTNDGSSDPSQHFDNDCDSYPQYNEGQHSSKSYSNSNQDSTNGYQEPFPPKNSYAPSPKTPKGHYNPENIDTTYQVSTSLKHVSKSVAVKKPPRSPKTPVALPFRVKEVPSPSIIAKSLKNSPAENYTNVAQSKPGPQIPYEERLPKSPKKEVFVTFPDGQMMKQFVDPNMAMMDLLIQLTAMRRLNPSGYLLIALSEDDNRPVDYKANQPVGLVNAHRVKLMSKERVKTKQMSQTGKTEKQLPFEMTYRLTVNLPHGQKVVRRMSANHPLHELHQSVCDEKNLDPSIFVFQLPEKPTSQVNLKYTLQELGLENYELNLIHRAELEHYMSVPNLSQTGPTWMNDQSVLTPSTHATYVHMPPPGDSRKKKGFFSFLRKDKRGKSSGDILNNRSSGKTRPASMYTPKTESFEGHLKNPIKSTKKKPAPPPPTGQPPATDMPVQQQFSNSLPGEAVNSGTDQGYQHFPIHSRSRSNYEQRTGTDPASRPSKIGTDSVTYLTDGDGRNNIRRLSTPQHQYVSAAVQGTPGKDHHQPEHGKNVTSANPPDLSMKLKTANDMYSSPCKKRRPAPLPPPGGPQVRPKRDIFASASLPPKRNNPDIVNVPKLSASTALDNLNLPNPTTAENVNTSRTPLITIKTEKPAQEDTHLIVEKTSQDECRDLEKTTEKMIEQNPLKDFDKREVSADDEFDTFEMKHNGEVAVKLPRPPCSFNAPPPPITPPPPPTTPPPAKPPKDIPSPVIIIGTEMVDKSVGISEDSPSLATSDASPHRGHARNLSKISNTSSIITTEEITFAFDETIAVAEEALQNELMGQLSNSQPQEQATESTLFVKVSSNQTTPIIKMKESKQLSERPTENGSPVDQFEGIPAYLTPRRESDISAEYEESIDTVATDITIESPSSRNRNCDLNSISSDGSFTTFGASDTSTDGVHITEAEVNCVLNEVPEVKQPDIEVTDIQVPPIPQNITNLPTENEKISNSKTSVVETEHFEVNGIEIGIEKTAALTKTKIGQQVTVIRPNLETNASLELSRSSSAAELAQYMESPKEEVLLTKQERQSLDYRGSPVVEVQKKPEEELKKEQEEVVNTEGSPKILLEGIGLSLDSKPELCPGDIETGPQGNLKKQIERWQKQLQEHLSDNSGLYTPQEQDKLKQKVDQWNKQLKELNVMDTSGFRLLEQNILKQQIELWQRKLLAKERQHNGTKKFYEQEIEFLKKQIAVWKKKIEVIEKSANLFTVEERDVLQQQIELWQSQLAKNDNMETLEKEQNLLKRQIEVWKKNLKEKKFAGHMFSMQEQDILKRQLHVWQKQLQWLKTGVSTRREILKEQINVWQLELIDVQKNPSEDSLIEQEILEQQIELWQSKLNQKHTLSEDLMLKQIDIWKRQIDTNRNVDDKYLVQEQMIIEKEIQLWNKRLSGDDVECENFIVLEQDLLHEKIELCQQKLKNNIEIDSPDTLLEQEILKLQVDLWQQKVSAMQEKKLAMINYKEEEQDILKFQIKLWEDKLIQPSDKTSAVALSEKGTELLAQEVDLWQRWLNVKKEKRENRIKFKLLDEELQKEQIRLWQDHLHVIKNDTLGYTEEEREILMQQIELWQKGLIERQDGKTIHLAAEQDILKKYIDLWYNKMKRNTASSISEERDDVRQQIEIWKKQLTMYMLDDNPLSHSARQEIINQQINIWQKKRERCSVDTDELTRIESEILQQQIELWQKDLMDYEQRMGGADKEMPKEQIKLLKRTLSQRKKDMDPEILEQEKEIVNRQIDLYQKKLDNDDGLEADFINDEQRILEQQIDLWHRKLCLPDEGKAFYSESEYDILQKQVSLWHQQLVAIQHRQEHQRKLAIQEQNLLKEQIKLWEAKLDSFTDPVFMVEEQDAMKDQIELWQQQLEEHKSIILNKTASTPDDPELRKMELMLQSQEEIIQSFKEGLKNLPENLKTRTSSPSVSPPPVPSKETKPAPKFSLEFPPPPDTFRDPEDFTAVKLKQTVPKSPPTPPTPPTSPPLTQALANLKKVSPPMERPISPVKADKDQNGIQRAVPAVVLKPAIARKPKRKLPEPVLSPREELMLEIKNFAGRTKLKGVKLKDTKWSGSSYS